MALLALLVLAQGCANGLSAPDATKSIIIPPGVANTVSAYADLVGGNEMMVKGYGIVVGLGENGSSEVPATLRKYVMQELLKRGVGSENAGAGALTPTRLLSDPDTALVVIGGRLPPAAPIGTRFDLHVEAPPQTQTSSLCGGYLMPAYLRFALAGRMRTFRESVPWGEAKGTVFVNPFIKRGKAGEQAKLRVGTVPNGGVVTRKRPLRLELRRSSYRMAHTIQRRLRQRFGDDVAEARTPSMINLTIPPNWHHDYKHFIELVMHTYVRGGSGAEEQYARQMTRAITLPTARYEDIALTWEAMGRQVLAVIQPMYASANEAAAFYSARTGLRLQDTLALNPIRQFAGKANSPLQIPAIDALGEARQFIRAIPTLKRLLSSSNELVRVAAYEALLKHDSSGSIRRIRISDRFILDVVATDRDYAVYATQIGVPKIVLFGRCIPVVTPVFFSWADDLVTVTDRPMAGNSGAASVLQTDLRKGVPADDDAARTIMIYRKLPWGGRRSPPQYVAPTAEKLIEALGMPPETKTNGDIAGLGLAYSQIVGVVQGMCESGHIPASFVLQRSAKVRRIYSSVTGVGRPDMPEDEEP